MRFSSLPSGVSVSPVTGTLPLWPPVLASAGAGTVSSGHSHHAMHLVLCRAGELRVRAEGERRWRSAAGVLTAPDVPHALDASGREVMIVFLDPESDAGARLRDRMRAPVRTFTASERDALFAVEPAALMAEAGVEWLEGVVRLLGGEVRARVLPHPRVKKVVRLLRTLPAGAETSLEALAAAVGLSPGRLMHAFTASVGIPLRPYLGWLRLQRAAAAIVGGAPLTEAALLAGFSDAAHMSRTFRRMLGMPPSALRPRR